MSTYDPLRPLDKQPETLYEMNPLHRLRVGDSVMFSKQLPEEIGRSVRFFLIGAAQISIVGTEMSGGAFTFYAKSSETATWLPGEYFWSLLSELSGDRKTVSTGSAIVLPDATVAVVPLDTRSHARRMFEAIEALIEGRITKDAESYEIHKRKLVRIPFAELLVHRDRYKAECMRQDTIAGVIKPRNKIHVRFGR